MRHHQFLILTLYITISCQEKENVTRTEISTQPNQSDANVKDYDSEDLEAWDENKFPMTDIFSLKKSEMEKYVDEFRDFYLNNTETYLQSSLLKFNFSKNLSAKLSLASDTDDYNSCILENAEDKVTVKDKALIIFIKSDISECFKKKLTSSDIKPKKVNAKLFTKIHYRCDTLDLSQFAGKKYTELDGLHCKSSTQSATEESKRYTLMVIRALADTEAKKDIALSFEGRHGEFADKGDYCKIVKDEKKQEYRSDNCSLFDSFTTFSAAGEVKDKTVYKIRLGAVTAKAGDRFFSGPSDVLINNWQGKGRVDASKVKLIFDLSDGKEEVTITKY